MAQNESTHDRWLIRPGDTQAPTPASKHTGAPETHNRTSSNYFVWTMWVSDMDLIWICRHFSHRGFLNKDTQINLPHSYRNQYSESVSHRLFISQSQRLTNTCTYTPVSSPDRDGTGSHEAKPQPSMNSQYGARFPKQNLPAHIS